MLLCMSSGPGLQLTPYHAKLTSHRNQAGRPGRARSARHRAHDGPAWYHIRKLAFAGR